MKLINNIDENSLTVFSPQHNDAELIGLRGEVKIWLDRPANEYPTEFLSCFNYLLEPVKNQLNWFHTYTMTKTKPITSRTFSQPKSWLEKGDQSVARMLYLRKARNIDSCGEYSLWFKYHPDEAEFSMTNTPFIKRSVPSRELIKQPEEHLESLIYLAERLPFICGHAGFCLETSRYLKPQSYTAAYPLGLRHHGVNIDSDYATRALRNKSSKGVEAVNWLTLVGGSPLRHLGGIKTLQQRFIEYNEIEVIPVGAGVLIKAGKSPQLGDTNRGDLAPLYRTVYQTLKPIMEPVFEQFMPFPLRPPMGVKEKTQRWLHRFEL